MNPDNAANIICTKVLYRIHTLLLCDCVDIHSQMFLKAIGLYTSANASVFKKYKRSPESKQF